MRSSRVFSVLSRFPHAPCVASSRGVCLILPDQPLFTSHLRGLSNPLNVPDRGIYGYAAGLSHAATKQLVPDGQISIWTERTLVQSWESMSRFLGLSENRKMLFQPDRTTLQAGLVPVRHSPLRYCSHGRPPIYFTIRETYRPLCASSLPSLGIPTLTCGSPWPPVEISVCRSLCSSSSVLGLPRCPCVDEIGWEGGCLGTCQRFPGLNFSASPLNTGAGGTRRVRLSTVHDSINAPHPGDHDLASDCLGMSAIRARSTRGDPTVLAFP